MTKNELALISLLRKSIFKYDDGYDFSNVDWEYIFNESVEQSIVPLVYDGVQDIQLPSEIKKKFKYYTVSVMQNNYKIISGQKKITELFIKNNIQYSLLKGLSISVLYPNPNLRVLGDVDIYVKYESLGDVKELLKLNGYNLIDNDYNHYHCSFEHDGIVFEIHKDISEFPDSDKFQKIKLFMNNSFDSLISINYEEYIFNALDIRHQFLSLVLHLERHVRKSGLGVRQILDVCLFIHCNKNILLSEEFDGFLLEYGLKNIFFILNEIYLFFSEGKEINRKPAIELLQYSLDNGNFGIKNVGSKQYANFAISSKNKSIKNWIIYFRNRSLYTWKLAKRFHFFSYFAFIWLPIRYFFRVVFKRRNSIDFSTVLKYSNKKANIIENFNLFDD